MLEIALTDVDRPNFNCRDALWTLLDDAKRFLPTEMPERGWDALQIAVRSTMRQRTYKNFNEDGTFAELLEDVFDKNLGVTQNRWTSRSDAKRHQWEKGIWVLQRVFVQGITRRLNEWCAFCTYPHRDIKGTITRNALIAVPKTYPHSCSH
jgi:hypothetical protein